MKQTILILITMLVGISAKAELEIFHLSNIEAQDVTEQFRGEVGSLLTSLNYPGASHGECVLEMRVSGTRVGKTLKDLAENLIASDIYNSPLAITVANSRTLSVIVPESSFGRYQESIRIRAKKGQVLSDIIKAHIDIWDKIVLITNGCPLN